jgi:hypothetical protein
MKQPAAAYWIVVLACALLPCAVASAGELRGWCRLDDADYSLLSPLPLRIDLRNDTDQPIEFRGMSWTDGDVKIRFRKQGSQDRWLILAGPDPIGCGLRTRRLYLPRRAQNYLYETMPLWKLPEELIKHERLEVAVEVLFENNISVTTEPASFRLKPVADELLHTTRLKVREITPFLHLDGPASDKPVNAMLALQPLVPEGDPLQHWLTCRCGLYEICHNTGKEDRERNLDKIIDTLRGVGPIHREGLGLCMAREIAMFLDGAVVNENTPVDTLIGLGLECIEPTRGINNRADHARSRLKDHFDKRLSLQARQLK